MRARLSVLVVALLGVQSSSAFAQALPGTVPWENLGNRPADMVAGIGRFLDRELEASVTKRAGRWKRDFSSPTSYQESVLPNRKRFAKIIGAVGERVTPVEISYVSGPNSPAMIAESAKFSVSAVRWSVYPGVDAEGLWLEPKGEVRANVVALADCDQTPEQLAGVDPGLARESRIGRWLAEAGCRVLIPTLLDRSDEFSGNPAVRMTNLPHREWIYRMAYETGRHPIGYEVDKVRAAIDWFGVQGAEKLPVAAVGFGEGGLIAFYAAAVDTRIDVAWVSGYFTPREKVWREPIYRNVWGLLEEFGDAEIASLVAPRGLLIEACEPPKVLGPPPPRNGRADAASGRIDPPEPQTVAAEFRRAQALVANLKVKADWVYLPSNGPQNSSDSARRLFLKKLGMVDAPEFGDEPLVDARKHVDYKPRMKRQVEQLSDYTQRLIRTSELRRSAYWAKANMSSVEKYAASIEPYREYFWDEVIGRFPPVSKPLSAKTKKLYDEPKFTGYAVQLPVWPDVVASGVLLLPKDLKPGERRPVVVCQHGLEGTPDPVVDPKIKSPYNAFGAQLADLGYIVYAPQNPYIGHDVFRQLQRRAHPLKKSLFAVIARQHERTLEWLATVPGVDPARIAFYGLSYGGKSAMRLPALLKGYCLSICSADFNEWVVKNTNLDRPYSYLYTVEYDMYEFALSEGYNYAEMAALIAPRPFQVERGHQDGVAPDEWIGYEYAKVKRLYDTLGLADRTSIAYFNGGHMIDGKETFAFLAKHLSWPPIRR